LYTNKTFCGLLKQVALEYKHDKHMVG
jgi:hypothetical protein